MSLLWGVVVVCVIGWLLGFGFHIGGDLIHILLVIAIIAVIYNLLIGRNNRVL